MVQDQAHDGQATAVLSGMSLKPFGRKRLNISSIGCRLVCSSQPFVLNDTYAALCVVTFKLLNNAVCASANHVHFCTSL